MIEVIPAIIPKSQEEIENKLGLVKNFVEKVQIDFVDGKYAPVKTWPFNLEKESGTKLEISSKDEILLEGDLMIKHPEDFLDDFLEIGIKSFVIHIGSTKYLDKCIFHIKEKGLKVGLAIRPSEDSKTLEEYLDKIDFVQFMGNDTVGYNGVELDRKVLQKISHFHSAHPFVPIQIDIGVNLKTASELIKAGVTGLVSGSAVFSDSKVRDNIEKLKYASK